MRSPTTAATAGSSSRCGIIWNPHVIGARWAQASPSRAGMVVAEVHESPNRLRVAGTRTAGERLQALVVLLHTLLANPVDDSCAADEIRRAKPRPFVGQRMAAAGAVRLGCYLLARLSDRGKVFLVARMNSRANRASTVGAERLPTVDTACERILDPALQVPKGVRVECQLQRYQPAGRDHKSLTGLVFLHEARKLAPDLHSVHLVPGTR